MSTGRFVWHDLVTTDVEGAKRFYTELLGWTYADFPAPEGSPPPETPYPMISAAGGAMPQGGIMAAQLPGVPPHWIGHVALPDADAVAERAKAAGGSVVFGPFDIPGVGRNVLIADPQGAAIGVITFAGEGMPAPEGPQPAGSFVWDELVTTDVPGAKGFYAGVAGWGARDWDGPVPYAMFTAGEASAAGLMARPPELQAPPAWIAYVNVDDLAATLAKTKELGGAVYAGPFTVPTIGQIGVIGDPQGAALGVIQPDLSGMAGGGS